MDTHFAPHVTAHQLTHSLSQAFTTAHGRDAPPRPAPRTRPPRLALVLGSGGVRSAAALGAVAALAEAGIAPDLIVGCSSGALMGAPLALGHSPRGALALATSLWSPALTQQRRWRAYLQLLAPRLAKFGPDFGLRDPRLITRALESAFGDARLESLPIALRVATTDAASGAPLTLTSGRLVDALRASMAVPFIFPSVALGGRRLVDGVISDPLPVAAAADAGVLLTLALEGAMPRRVDRASRLAAQATTALINNLQEARLTAMRARGARIVELRLELTRRVGLWETAALPSLYDAGFAAGQRALPALRSELAAAPARMNAA
jgi:NTE family protein